MAPSRPWLTTSAATPKRLITFEGPPTPLIGEAMVAWRRANLPALEVVAGGAAGHYAPEDQPAAIARAPSAWLDRRAVR